VKPQTEILMIVNAMVLNFPRVYQLVCVLCSLPCLQLMIVQGRDARSNLRMLGKKGGDLPGRSEVDFLVQEKVKKILVHYWGTGKSLGYWSPL
jgi:hypothetical protein